MARNQLSEFEIRTRKEISSNLKKYTKNITQGKLSEMTGIPASTISGYFAERSTINAGNLQKIADVLNINKSDIDPRFNEEKQDDGITLFRFDTSGLSNSEAEEFEKEINEIAEILKERVQRKNMGK